MVDEKRSCFRRWKRTKTAEDRLNYVDAKRVARRLVWLAQDTKKAEELAREDKKRKFFGVAKQMKKERTGTSCVQVDEPGSIVREK